MIKLIIIAFDNLNIPILFEENWKKKQRCL